MDKLAEIRARENGPPAADCGRCSCCYDKTDLLELVDRYEERVQVYGVELDIRDKYVIQYRKTIMVLQQRVRELEKYDT